MNMSETNFPFLEEDCLQRFGAEQGHAIFQSTSWLYAKLLENTDDRGSAAIREHLKTNLLPPMAYYKVLRVEGFEQEEALELVRAETHKAAEHKKEELHKLADRSFAYTLFRMGIRKHMKKKFPREGWKTEWVKSNQQEIHFDLHSCLYWDVTNANGCPELCAVYCENDGIAFSGLLPQIRFTRSGTIAGGASCCDFHFAKGKE